MTVLIRSVQYVQLLSGYFTLKAFLLWLSDLLQYQNHKNLPSLRYQNTTVYYRCMLLTGMLGV